MIGVLKYFAACIAVVAATKWAAIRMNKYSEIRVDDNVCSKDMQELRNARNLKADRKIVADAKKKYWDCYFLSLQKSLKE